MKPRHVIIAVLAGVVPVRATLAASDTATGATGMLQMLPGLALVLLLIVALAWLAKRGGVGRGAAGGILRIVAERAVGSRERVVVVEVGGQWLVLGVAPGQVRSLARMARPESAAAEATVVDPRPPFAMWLERALKKS